METNDVLALGPGIAPPWKLIGQRLDTDRRPNKLHIEFGADRGAWFPCPDCGRPCKAHDFADFTWRHLNFFQHHCYITARVLRTDCPDHRVKRIEAPWAREGSRFTLLFKQAAMMLAREMPVLAAARIIGITDQRLWRIIEHYVGQAVESEVVAFLGSHAEALTDDGRRRLVRHGHLPEREMMTGIGPVAVRAPLRSNSVNGSENIPGWESLKTLLSVTAYHSLAGEVEVRIPPRYAVLPHHAVTNFRA